MVYALSISVFGGSTEFTAAWLTSVTRNPMAPAWYMTAAVAVSMVAIALLPETAPDRAPDAPWFRLPWKAVTAEIS